MATLTGTRNLLSGSTRLLLSRATSYSNTKTHHISPRLLAATSIQHNPLQCRFFSSYPPHEVVGMPSLSPTMESGSVSSWSKSEGDEFIAGDVLCEVETDKATVDFEAQDDGYIAKILVGDGVGEIPCGTPIMITVEEEGDVGAFKDYVAESAPAAAAAATPEPVVVAEPVTTAVPAAVAAPAPVAAVGGRVNASPLAHALAKAKVLDITQIVGTGPGGRIIAADVEEFVPAAVLAAPAAVAAVTATAPAPTVSAPVVGDGFTDYPVTPSSLAALLSTASQNIPHFYLSIDLSLDDLLKLRESLNASVGEDSQISLNDLMIKATAAAVRTVPSVNASWMDTFVRQYRNVDINVVMKTEEGLYQPCLKSVQTTGLASISSALSLLSEDPTSAEHAKMGTFTVFNGGMYGIKSSAMIIRQPQACALSLGAAETKIVPAEDGGIKRSVVMTATLSCDHRVINGDVGAQWLQAFKGCVENPASLLL